MAFLSIQYKSVQFSSVQLLSCVRLFVTPWTAARQTSLSITDSRVHSNSCPLSRWCHPIISSSVVPLSSCLQSFPASGSVPMNQFFESGGQIIGVSALASVLPMNEYSGLISFRMDWLDLLAIQGTLKSLCHQLWSCSFPVSPLLPSPRVFQLSPPLYLLRAITQLSKQKTSEPMLPERLMEDCNGRPILPTHFHLN